VAGIPLRELSASQVAPALSDKMPSLNFDANTRERKEASKTDVMNQLRSLGVKVGGILLVHTSFRETICSGDDPACCEAITRLLSQPRVPQRFARVLI
jgi:hypothetical protein